MANDIGAVDWPARTARLSIRPADRGRPGGHVDVPPAARGGEWLTRLPTDREATPSSSWPRTGSPRPWCSSGTARWSATSCTRVEDAWAQTEVEEQAKGTQAELGWVIAPEHAGQGYATEAAPELLRISFEDLGLRRVVRAVLRRQRGVVEADGAARDAPGGARRGRVAAPDSGGGSTACATPSSRTSGELVVRRRSDAAGPERGRTGRCAPSGWPSARRRAEDADPMFVIRRRPEVAEWLPSQPADPAEWAEKFAEPDRLAVTLALELDGEIIGDLYLNMKDAWAQAEVEEQAKATQAEIGWVVAPEHAGRGYGTEAAGRAAPDLLRGPRPAPRGRALLRGQPGLLADHGEARDAPRGVRRTRVAAPDPRLARRHDLRDPGRRVAGRTAGRGLMPQDLGAVDWPVRTERLSIRPCRPTTSRPRGSSARNPGVGEWLGQAHDDRAEYEQRFNDPDRMAKVLVVERDGQVVGDQMLVIGDAWGQAEVAEQAKARRRRSAGSSTRTTPARGTPPKRPPRLLRICFESLGLRRVIAISFADNVPSWGSWSGWACAASSTAYATRCTGRADGSTRSPTRCSPMSGAPGSHDRPRTGPGKHAPGPGKFPWPGAQFPG